MWNRIVNSGHSLFFRGQTRFGIFHENLESIGKMTLSTTVSKYVIEIKIQFCVSRSAYFSQETPWVVYDEEIVESADNFICMFILIRWRIFPNATKLTVDDLQLFQ